MASAENARDASLKGRILNALVPLAGVVVAGDDDEGAVEVDGATFRVDEERILVEESEDEVPWEPPIELVDDDWLSRLVSAPVVGVSGVGRSLPEDFVGITAELRGVALSAACRAHEDNDSGRLTASLGP